MDNSTPFAGTSSVAGVDTVNPPRDDDELLTTEQLARALKVSESYLEKCRMRGTGPPFEKFGRTVRYRWGTVRHGWRDGLARPRETATT
jgi:hypothetical protein